MRRDKVTVAYVQGGKPRTLTADFCISTIPAPIFDDAQDQSAGDLPWRRRAKLPVQAAGKVGWQAERFWETKDQIYGGISWTTDVITQIWYPSSGYLSRKGTLTGAYMYGAAAERVQRAAGRRAAAHRQGAGRQAARRLLQIRRARPGDRLGTTWSSRAWAGRTRPIPRSAQHCARLLSEPQGRFHMAGDQLTYWSGWQEGAMMSALAAVGSIDRLARAAATRRG